jgi:hypothetical protein
MQIGEEAYFIDEGIHNGAVERLANKLTEGQTVNHRANFIAIKYCLTSS